MNKLEQDGEAVAGDMADDSAEHPHIAEDGVTDLPPVSAETVGAGEVAEEERPDLSPEAIVRLFVEAGIPIDTLSKEPEKTAAPAEEAPAKDEAVRTP